MRAHIIVMNNGATKAKRFYCGHCKEEVSRTTLYAHKRLYYNRTTNSQTRVIYTSGGADLDRSLCAATEPRTDEGSQSDLDIRLCECENEGSHTALLFCMHVHNILSWLLIGINSSAPQTYLV